MTVDNHTSGTSPRGRSDRERPKDLPQTVSQVKTACTSSEDGSATAISQQRGAGSYPQDGVTSFLRFPHCPQISEFLSCLVATPVRTERTVAAQPRYLRVCFVDTPRTPAYDRTAHPPADRPGVNTTEEAS
jgi:hypothetical protein